MDLITSYKDFIAHSFRGSHCDDPWKPLVENGNS